MQPFDVGISKEDIDNGKASKQFPGSKFGEVILDPTVVICAAYRPSFDEHKVYHTSYILDLIRLIPGWPGGGTDLFKIGENVPADKLRLRLHVQGAIVAD